MCSSLVDDGMAVIGFLKEWCFGDSGSSISVSSMSAGVTFEATSSISVSPSNSSSSSCCLGFENKIGRSLPQNVVLAFVLE